MIAPSTPERPINQASEDRLHRIGFIQRLAATLINPVSKKSTGLVIGLEGPWGSGKSSLLNLLAAEIVKTYPDAAVVRFNPWLVSARHDLIKEFFDELLGTLKPEESQKQSIKKLGATLTKYGSKVASAGNLILPGAGSAMAGVLDAAGVAFSQGASLSALRKKLFEELSQVEIPIVVLIDEVDRLDDVDILAIAQLVSAVGDLPNVSYVLGYDANRVIQALGAGASGGEREARGRSYLEKIVHLQLPIPIILENEVIDLLVADIRAIAGDFPIPDKFEKNERFEEYIRLVTGGLIRTPRDVKRLIGTYRSIMGMIAGEVDWIDVLAYSTLLTKAPLTVEKMKAEPHEFIDDARSWGSISAYIDRSELSEEDLLKRAIANSEDSNEIREVIRFLLPNIMRKTGRKPKHRDAFCEPRPFYTTLRLGLIPGSYARPQVEELILSDAGQISEAFRIAYDNDSLGDLIDRVDDIYSSLFPFDQHNFWRGAAKFVRKPDSNWLTSPAPMDANIRSLQKILPSSVLYDPSNRENARQVYRSLREAAEDEITTYWLRDHMFVYGLYDCRRVGGNDWFLTEDETKSTCQQLSRYWRQIHLDGKLIPCRWSLRPVYIMDSMGLWDDACRDALVGQLDFDPAVEGLAILLCGPGYTSGTDFIKRLLPFDIFSNRIRARLSILGDSPEAAGAVLSLKMIIGEDKS